MIFVSMGIFVFWSTYSPSPLHRMHYFTLQAHVNQLPLFTYPNFCWRNRFWTAKCEKWIPIFLNYKIWKIIRLFWSLSKSCLSSFEIPSLRSHHSNNFHRITAPASLLSIFVRIWLKLRHFNAFIIVIQRNQKTHF